MSPTSSAPPLHQWVLNLAQHIDFESLILHGMLPLLLFAGAFLLDLEQLAKREADRLAALRRGHGSHRLPGGGTHAPVTGIRIPWMQCLIFGALISPTDPIAVLEMLRRTGVPKAIQAQLAGESLFNDGIGAVLFLTMIEVGPRPDAHATAHRRIPAAQGRRRHRCRHRRCVDYVSADAPRRRLPGRYPVHHRARAWRLCSWPNSCISPRRLRPSWRALPCATSTAIQPKERIAHDSVDGFWEVIDEVQNSVLFVLLGLEIMAVTVNAQAIGAGLAAILSVNVVRLVAVAGLLALVRLIKRGHRSSTFVLTWGGLRGGLSIALALSVPEALGRSWMLGATYLVVLFSIVFQGGSMDRLLRWKARKTAAA